MDTFFFSFFPDWPVFLFPRRTQSRLHVLRHRTAGTNPYVGKINSDVRHGDSCFFFPLFINKLFSEHSKLLRKYIAIYYYICFFFFPQAMLYWDSCCRVGVYENKPTGSLACSAPQGRLSLFLIWERVGMCPGVR